MAHPALQGELHLQFEDGKTQGAVRVWLKIQHCRVGPVELDRAAVERLASAVQEATSLITTAAEAQGATVETDISPDA